MDRERIERFNQEFPAHSALYHAVKGLLFLKGDYAHEVIDVREDRNDRNLKICNERRMKNRLFREIKKMYNERIDEHGLSLNKISDFQKESTEIVKFRLVRDVDKEQGDYSGQYMIYPRTFVCSKCGDLVDKRHFKDLDTFNPRECRREGCNGEYEQVSIVLFCEVCGRIKPLEYSCRIHGSDNIKLIRGKKDSLVTWKVACQKCLDQGNQTPIDIFWLTCDHHGHREVLETAEKTKLKALTLKEGGVYTPVTITLVDIPQTESIELSNLEYILLGLYLGRFDIISQKIDRKVEIEDIESYLRSYHDQRVRNMIFSTNSDFKGISIEEKEKKWREMFFVDILDQIVNKLKNEYQDVDLENFNDYFAISNKESRSYDEFLVSLREEQRSSLKQKYHNLRRKFGIEDILYIPSINLVCSCIGIINGINRFYKKGFTPHFSPIWDNNQKKNKMIIYSYPFETEGILIKFDTMKVCRWLLNNHLIKENADNHLEARNLLLKIQEESESYDAVKKLLHTLSHLLIRRSSLYTGLDSDSCGELIFVNSATIFIYSTSEVCIGGFEFVFEHSLSDWFRDVEFEAEECTFDPACMNERGACFSCLYLPEYVCTEFNKYLDRDTIIGKERYHVGYWQHEE